MSRVSSGRIHRLSQAGGDRPARSGCDDRGRVGRPGGDGGGPVRRAGRTGAALDGLRRRFRVHPSGRPAGLRQPGGPAISLALIRLPATDQRHRIGSLLTNPGGPATSGVDSIRGTPKDAYPPGMRGRFDIIGFDPRGVARSSPIRCFPTNEAKARFFAHVPLFPITRQDEVAFIAKTAELGRTAASQRLDHAAHVHGECCPGHGPAAAGAGRREAELLRRVLWQLPG